MKNFCNAMRTTVLTVPVFFGLFAVFSCNKEGTSAARPIPVPAESSTLSPAQVACLLADMPLEMEQIREVYEAVSASAGNGYDEEYTFCDLLESPGSGVGDARVRACSCVPLTRTGPSREYARPLRDLLSSAAATRTGDPGLPERFLDQLAVSGLQIYWPYSEDWDGKTFPVITFNPENGSESNVGFLRQQLPNGDWIVAEMPVDESVARKRPVWVVNRNEDASGMPPQLLEKLTRGCPSTETRSGSGELKTLILKEFRSSRNFDSWFAGASEFYVKCGSVEHFAAASEEELRNYRPTVTDFMIVVRRKQVNRTIGFNAVLVSEWTSQLEDSAFLIIEDDGGPRTSWKCSTNVRIKSKVYGFDVDLPFRRNDDIVWRGRLSNRYFERYNNIMGHFGDVSITFRIASM